MNKIHHIKATSNSAVNYYRTTDGFSGHVDVDITGLTVQSQAAWAACWQWMVGEVTANGWTMDGGIDIDVKEDGAVATGAVYDGDGDLVTPAVYRDVFIGSATVSKNGLKRQAQFTSEDMSNTLRGYLIALNDGTQAVLNT